MLKSHLAVSLFFLSLPSALTAQVAPPKSDAPPPDYSKEAFVIEQFSSKVKFENDGTSTRQDAGRIRIQSEAGVQQYSVLSFSYASGTGTFEIKYLRVRKPDGSVVDTPPENVQDMAAEITRAAPLYSDLHEKHAAVKGLSAGDVLEYQIEEHTTKPLAPGQFWLAYNFTHQQIVLDEQLEISVPRERAIKTKSSKIQSVISEAGGYRTYTWHNSNLQNQEDSNAKREATEQVWKGAQGKLPAPEVEFSSFTSWEEVGRWYGALQDERVKPTPDIVAKATELTKTATNDDAKLRALYSYVSTQFHYIGIDFGIGRYQPHSAAEVLANQYGDCKDKHTLLASLLTAVGIPAFPAIISTTQDVDEDVPSPGQFNHVITVVPREGGLVWLDTTTEVGPYQYLVSPLRDKRALVVWKDKPALVNTPADLPYPSSQTFTMNAKLSDAGTLEGQAELSSRGDAEYAIRGAFRTVPLPQWKDLVQQISLNFGFGGDVSEVTASSPEKTDEPFHFSYKYTRKEFGDWASRRILAPEPYITLPSPIDEERLPLGPSWLGPLIDIQFNSRLELPSGYRPSLPAAIHLKTDFAQFDATYDFKDGAMLSTRHFKNLLKQVPANERGDYKRFAKTVQDDYGVFIPLLSGSGSSASVDQQDSNLDPMSGLRNLPDSPNAEATELENEARQAMSKRDAQTAVSSLYRAVAADPNFARAWVILGGLLLAQKQTDAGIDAFHKAMAAEPSRLAIPKKLGLGLMATFQFAAALPVWQDFVKQYPDDLDGAVNLGQCLLRLKRNSEAVTAFDAAAKIGGNLPKLQMSIASAYLKAGEREKAGNLFRKLGETDSAGTTLNDAAYEMAKADLDLPLALEYSTKATRKANEESQTITLPDLKVGDLRDIFKVASYWDTLGWVNERMSNFDVAEQYLRASWQMTQSGAAANHLCHLYDRIHKTGPAIQMCRFAMYRLPSAGMDLTELQNELIETMGIL